MKIGKEQKARRLIIDDWTIAKDESHTNNRALPMMALLSSPEDFALQSQRKMSWFSR